jgi:hypothetical protein
MGVAFEMARAALKLTARDESIKSLIAGTIIELAKAGELDPERLCGCSVKPDSARLARQPARVGSTAGRHWPRVYRGSSLKGR